MGRGGKRKKIRENLGNGDGPFVPVPKGGLLVYLSEERKKRSMSDRVGNLYELDHLEFSFPPTGVSRHTRPCILQSVFLTVDLERKSGITGVPFGRTELSLRLS